MGVVVCFGEVMMRLCPPGYLRLSQTDKLEMTFGEAEAGHEQHRQKESGNKLETVHPRTPFGKK